MKISQVQVIFAHPIAAGKESPQRPILIRIDTDEGIHGIGELGMAYGVGQNAAVGILQDFGKQIILNDAPNR